jgi:hypothetical protein
MDPMQLQLFRASEELQDHPCPPKPQPATLRTLSITAAQQEENTTAPPQLALESSPIEAICLEDRSPFSMNVPRNACSNSNRCLLYSSDDPILLQAAQREGDLVFLPGDAASTSISSQAIFERQFSDMYACTTPWRELLKLADHPRYTRTFGLITRLAGCKIIGQT